MGEYVIIIIGAAILIVELVKLINAQSDHSGWDDQNKKPDINASITKINHQKVSFIMFRSKMKTTVTFSDGFYYTSGKTKTAQVDARHYSISVDREMTLDIVEKAIKAHADAVNSIEQKQKSQ